MEVVVSIGIVIVSGLTIFMGMEPGILIAGVVVAILFYIIRTKVVAKSYRLTGDEARILITDQFVKMNKRFVHYKNGTHFLKDIEVYKEPEYYILLVVAWPTGRGFDNSIDLRLPVPDDEIDNLPMVLEQLELAKKRTESNSSNIV